MTAIDEEKNIIQCPAKADTRHNQNLFFLLMIAIMPVQLMPLVTTQIAPIPGFKLSNIIVLIPFLILLNDNNIWRTNDKLERVTLRIFAIYVLLFFVAFWRSIPNIGTFVALFPRFFATTPLGYALYEFITPMLFASSFLYVIKKMRTAEQLLQVCFAIGIGIFCLSTIFLVAVFLNPQLISTPNRAGMGQLCNDYLGMYYTDVGTMYLMSAPILLYLALKRGAFWTLNFILALIAVILVQARTAMAIFAFGSIATLIVMGRTRVLLRMAPIVLTGVFVMLGPILFRLLTLGITGKYGFTWHFLLSGRDDLVWLPLLVEWWSVSSRFWFGAGLHGMLISEYLRMGAILPVAEAHNMFIELFLDYGILLTVAVIVAIVAWFIWAIRLGLKMHSGIYSVLVICVASFFISGLTGRHFLPNVENMLMFPILGILVNVARLKLYGSKKMPALPAAKSV